MSEQAAETVERAGDDIVDGKPGTEVVVPTTNVEGLKDLADQLSVMHQRMHNIVYNLKSTAGDKQARKDRKDLVSTRTALTSRGAELKRTLRASVATQISQIDADTDRMVEFVRKYEQPLDEMIAADEQRREDERLERLRAEEARTNAHRERITAMTDVAVRAVGLSSAEIQAKIELVTRLQIDSAFEEFEAVAINSKAETLLRLADLFSNTKQAEEKEEQARIDRERLAQLERENAERVVRENAERAERERVEAVARQAEQDRVAAEQRAAAKRAQQSGSANALIEEVRLIQRRGIKASAAGMLELVGLVENIRVGEELGDFQGVALKARDDALADLHDLHETKVASEAEERRVHDQQAAAQRRLDEQAEALRKQQEEMAARERAAAPPPAEPEAPAESTTLITNPYTGTPRDIRDVESDPAGVLIHQVGVPLLAAMEEAGALTDAAGDPGDEEQTDGEGDTPDVNAALTELLYAVVALMKSSESTLKRGKKPGPWIVQHEQMLTLKASLRAVPLPGGQYYAEDGTLMTAEGKRSIFDDVDA